MTKMCTIVLMTLFSLTAFAQAEPQDNTNSVPVYHITVVARTIKAINYRHRSGSTKVEFRGTGLMPDARGTAEVQSKQGVIHVDAEWKHLQPASKFGPEYLTYVLWAISPEGRPVNLGEVVLDGSGNSKAERDERPAVLRSHRHRGTPLCSDSTQRCGGDGELRYQRNERDD